MKKFTFNFETRFFNLATIVGALLFSVGIWAQTSKPTVTVPMNCNVVVAGEGGSTGPGGEVGDGGIVIMPDPGSGDFTINDNGTTLQSYVLKGDLSFTEFPDAINQSTSSLLTSPQTIYSFNKNERESEGLNGSSSTLARSKGRMYIYYTDPPCEGRIEFDVYKKYSYNPNNYPDEYVPSIIGPSCWLPDSSYTYSVDQIASDNLGDGIGIDSYYWTVTNGNEFITEIYTSADNSSITFDAPGIITGDWYIECCYGRANNWDGNGEYTTPAGTPTTCVQFPIGEAPKKPLVVIDPECVPIGAESFTVGIDLINLNPNYVPSFNHSWSSSNPTWTFTSPNDVSTTVTNLDGGPGTIILTVENTACETSSEFEFQVNRSFQAPDVYIDPSPSCIEQGAEVTFSIEGLSGVQSNNTTWPSFLPLGWNIIDSNGTNSVITVAIPIDAEVGVYTIEAFSTATECSNSSVSIDVYIKPQAPEFLTTGNDSPACVEYDATSDVTYTATAPDGATGYEWIFPQAWTPETVTTSSPTVNITPVGSGNDLDSVIVIAKGYGNCHSDSTLHLVNYKAIKPEADLDDLCWNFGLPGVTEIQITNAPDPFFGTYEVTSQISNPVGSDEFIDSVHVNNGVITVYTSASVEGEYKITIKHVTGEFCNSEENDFFVDVYPILDSNNDPLAITPTYNPGINADIYTITIPSGSSITWTLLDSSDDPIVDDYSSPTGNILVLQTPNVHPDKVCANVILNNCTTRVCVDGGAYGLNRPSGQGSMDNNTGRTFLSNDKIKIYPNPNNGAFTIELSDFNQVAELNVLDMNGRIVSQQMLKKGSNTFSKDLASGIYLLIINIDGNFSSHKVEVSTKK